MSKSAKVVLASAQVQSFSAEDLTHRTVERRAVEAVDWGMPAVNFDLMFRAMIDSARVASQPGFTIAGRGRKTQVAASPSASSYHLARYPSCGLDCENAGAWCYERPILWMIVLEKRLLVDRRLMLKDAIPHTGCRRLGR